MTKTQIWYLIKFFQTEAYADAFMRGELYLNRLSYFRKMECGKEGGRADDAEAVAIWLQPNDLIINLDIPSIGSIQITKADLAGPVSMSFAHHEHLHLFCLYAVFTDGYDTIDGKLDLAPEQVEDLQRQVRIDTRTFQLGPIAVITPAVPFLNRVKEALQARGQWFEGRLVEYYDDAIFHGEIPYRDIPFRKQKRFAYQNEFRICLHTGVEGDGAIIIPIGDISGICAKVMSDRLNELLTLRREPIETVGTK